MSAFTWNVEPELFHIGSYALRWYSLLFGGGFVVGHYMTQRMWHAEGRDVRECDTGLVYLVIGTIVGARLGHCLFYDPVYYLSHPIEILKVWTGGLASHGGFLGVGIAAYLLLRKLKSISFLELADRVVVPMSLVAAMIRLGNLFNSEMIGHPTDLPWAVVFAKIDQIPRHPTQVYESIGYFMCFALLTYLYWKTPAKTRVGLLTGVAFVAATIVRIAVEALKEDQSAFEAHMPLNMGQLLSLPFLAAGIWLVVRALKGEPKTPELATAEPVVVERVERVRKNGKKSKRAAS
jgi:prolipoprotein diacylglyceryl transferase